MGIYDVAVWVCWSTEVLPYTAEPEAASPIEAVIAVMRVNGLERVEHAAVKLPDSSFLRWEEGLILSRDEIPRKEVLANESCERRNKPLDRRWGLWKGNMMLWLLSFLCC
jgi:hypothetical protein